MTSDLNLLRQFARDNSQDAFAEIVLRHVDLVYSAAVRQVRSPQLAEEVAQSVFTDLARVAATPSSPLRSRDASSPQTLTPWLYAVTRRTAIDAIRKESRRQLREQIAVEMNAMNVTASDWTHVEPFLDEAMHTLDDTDRAAVLLRYFENKSLREVGATLGVSDDTAQKRVSRAVERLREFFIKRGVTIGASGLVVIISANAVQAAPAGLASTISAAAAFAGAAVHTSTVIAATKTIAMTTLQKTIITATLASAVGTGIFEAHQAAQLREQNQMLQQQQAPLAQQIRQLQQEQNDAKNQLAALLAENEQLKLGQNRIELLRLRGEVTQLRNEANDPADVSAKDLVARVNKLKQRLEQTPNAKIPELQLLNEQDWLTACRGWNLDSESGFRQAFSALRCIAEQTFASMAGRALAKYSQANDKQFPTDLSQLQSYFDSPVDAAILERWKILPAGATIPGIGDKGPFITQKAPVDELLDRQFAIGLNGFSCTDFLTSEIQDVMMPVYQAYAAANNGLSHDDPSQLLPYATTPEQQAAVQKLIQQSAASK